MSSGSLDPSIGRSSSASGREASTVGRNVAAGALLAAALGFSAFFSGTAGELPLQLWCALCCVLWGWASPRRPEGMPASGLVALFALLWSLVAWRTSIAPSFSLAGTWGVMLLPLAVLTTSSAQRPHLALAVAMPVCALLVLLAFADMLSPLPLRPVGLRDPNNVATLANLLWIPVAMGLLAVRDQRPWRLVALCLVGACASMVLVASASRAGVAIALAAALVVCGLGVLSRRYVAVGLLVLGALLGLVPGSTTTQPGDFAIAQEFANLDRSGIGLRYQLVVAALKMFASAPLTGTGSNTFFLLYEGLRTPQDQQTAGVYVHNDWVQLPQEFGLPMLLVLLLLLAWLLLHAWRALRAFFAAPRGDGCAQLPLLGLVLAIGSALVHATVNFPLYTPTIALLLGVMIGVVARSAPAPGVSARPFLGAWGLATLMLFPLAFDAVSAAAFMGHRGMPGLQTSAQPREGLAQTLRRLAPDDSIPPFYLARVRLREAAGARDADARRYALASAAAYYEEAMARDPWNVDVMLAYAELLTQLGGSLAVSETVTRTDVGLLEAARARNPRDSRLLFALAARYEARGRREDERAMLAAWLEYCEFHWRKEPERLHRALERARTIDAPFEASCDRPIPELPDAQVSAS